MMNDEKITYVDLIRNSTKFSGLKIDLSYHCPLECDHCLFDSRPSCTVKGMSDKQLCHVIQTASEMGSFYSLSVGHQENFTQFGRLCGILRCLKTNFEGYGVALNTTAHWVKSRDFAVDRLRVLKDLGLETLMISVDDFHQQQVSIEKCIDCVSAAQELKIKVIIQCAYSVSSNRMDYYKSLMQPHLSDKNLDWAESPFCPSGRARDRIPVRDWPKRSYADGGCSIMKIIYVSPSGYVTPCCGGGLTASGLVVGNLFAKSMNQICMDIEQDPIINSLAIHQGPAGLIDVLKKEHHFWQPRPYYTGTCHACYEILSDDCLVRFLREILDRHKVDLLVTRLYMESKNSLFAPEVH
jgi:hypothetical protein